MAGIARFTPSDLGGQQFTQNDVAGAVQNAFYKAQENMRQNREEDRQTERFGMEKERFSDQQEAIDYDRTLRPLREQEMQLGLASRGLQVASQSVNLQSAQNQIKVQELNLAEQSTINSFLDQNQNWMVDQGQQKDAPAAGDLVSRVKGFEGFSSSKYGDYKQESIGYGTKALPGETQIDEATADKRLREELAGHERRVDNYAAQKGLALSPNQRDALISFDYNTGAAPRVLDRANGDMSRVPEIMQEWRNAGGKVLPGLVNRRRQEAAWFNSDGTGIPTTSQVVSAATPTGVPVVAAAANSLNPQAVIAQAFTPLQQQALSRYDALGALVKNAPTPTQQMRALQQMQQMEADPRFQEAKAQKDEMVRTVQAQVQARTAIQSAPDDLVAGFNARYSTRFAVKNVNGLPMPVDAKSGQPLDSQGYAAWSRAFSAYAEDYKYDPSAATNELRQYEDAVVKLAAVSEFLQRKPVAPTFQAPAGPDGKPLEPDSKVYQEAFKNYQSQVSAYNLEVRQMGAIGAELNLRARTNPRIAEELNDLRQRFAPPTEVDVPTIVPASTARPASIKALARARPDDAEGDIAWTEGKQKIDQSLALEFPDTGEASADNAALTLAARIYEGESEARLDALMAAGLKPNDTAFEHKGRTGFDKVPNWEVLQAWAEDKLIRYGYLDPSTKKPVKAGAVGGGMNIKSIREVK